MLETNIDDMSGEIYSYVLPKLFDLGVADAFLTNIIMKKGRPAIKISILTKETLIKEVEKLLFKETSTLGIRRYPVERDILERSFETLDLGIGSVKIKKGYLDGKCINQKAEYSDCERLAKENNISLKDIYNLISKNIR